MASFTLAAVSPAVASVASASASKNARRVIAFGTVANPLRASSVCLRARAAPAARRLSVVTRAAADEGVDPVGPKAAAAVSLDYKNVLLPVIDTNPYLSEGTKQAAATVAALQAQQNAKVTVLVVDHKDDKSDPSVMEETIRWHLAEGGCTDFSLVHQEAEKPSVAVGDVADELEADLVVLAAGAVHSGLVDANLVAEFVPCSVLYLP